MGPILRFCPDIRPEKPRKPQNKSEYSVVWSRFEPRRCILQMQVTVRYHSTALLGTVQGLKYNADILTHKKKFLPPNFGGFG
jgi:hypothetical protein